MLRLRVRSVLMVAPGVVFSPLLGDTERSHSSCSHDPALPAVEGISQHASSFRLCCCADGDLRATRSDDPGSSVCDWVNWSASETIPAAARHS